MLHWISNLRVFATIAVVLIHASAGGLVNFKKIKLEWWWVCNAFDSFGRFAVPVFVMLSGYLLIGRYEDLQKMLSKRISRVFIPFFIWSLLYVLWSVLYEKKHWGVEQIITKIVSMKGSDHLWFIYMILGLYAFLPVISRWIRQAPEIEIRFFILMWVFVSCLYPLVERLFGISIGYDLHNFSGYVGYFVLGYWLGNKSLKQPIWIWGVGFLISWLFTAIGTYYLTIQKGIFDAYFYDYLSPNVILMSVCIFLFFQYALNKPFAGHIIQKFDTTSFGIYLSHVMVLRILSRQYHINYIWHHPVIGILAQSILCLIICYSLITIIKKLPKGGWLTG